MKVERNPHERTRPARPPSFACLCPRFFKNILVFVFDPIKSHIANILLVVVSCFLLCCARDLFYGVVSGLSPKITFPSSAAILDEPAILLRVWSAVSPPKSHSHHQPPSWMSQPSFWGCGQRCPQPKHAPTISRHLE